MNNSQENQIGDWKYIRILGRGSFGVVTQWKNLKNNKFIAVKKFEIRQHDSTNNQRINNEMKERWKKEVDLMYNLVDSPYIVSTIHPPPDLAKILSQKDNLPLLVMEYCIAGDLRALLKKPENIAGLVESQVKAVLTHISTAISYLHDKNIIHRDLKPENIILGEDSSGVVYKLSDLGFHKDLSNGKSLCSTVVGTLQYLAPEIYTGKMYDKTVDFWSFGLIAFEITCGMRPFLHGESPAEWIPLVEQKEKDIIAIYRNDEGKVEFSKEIPFFTHLSGLFKACLETWLRTMLQLDPLKRGRKLTIESNEIPSLNVLSTILRTKYFEIKHASKQLIYAIGNSTKIENIHLWVYRDTGINVEDQLFLDSKGQRLEAQDYPSKYIDSEIFLIPTGSSLKFKLKMPRILPDFLTNWENIKDSRLLRLVWSSAIYFIQSELNRINILDKSTQALKCWIDTNYVKKRENLLEEIASIIKSLDRILILEVKLDEIDLKFDSNQSSRIKIWTVERDNLSFEFERILHVINEKVTFKDANAKGLQEIYTKILKSLTEWRNPESASSGNKQIEVLVKSICLFVAQRNPIFEAHSDNNKALSKQIEIEMKNIQSLETIAKKFNTLIDAVMENRCKKQNELWMNFFGGIPSTVNSTVKSPKACSTRNLVGGGKITMSKSMPSPESPTENKQSSSQSLQINKGNSNVAKILEESQMLQSMTEDSLKSALNTVTSIMSEKSSMDWEFL